MNRNNVERPELGTTDNPWKSLHVESIYFTHDILPDTIDGHYINLGSDDRKFGSLYLYDTLLTNRIAVGYDILPVSGFDPSIGSNELRFKNIYAKNIYSEQINSVIGNINQFSTFADVEIGTVILAVIRPRNRITNGIGLKTGSVIDCNGFYIHYCGISTWGSEGQHIHIGIRTDYSGVFYSGRWKLLSEAIIGDNGDYQYGVALVQRVPDNYRNDIFDNNLMDSQYYSAGYYFINNV